MSKRLLSLLLAVLLMFTLFACNRSNGDEGGEQEGDPVEEPGGLNENWKIGVVTGTLSQSEEEYQAAQNMLKLYGEDRIVHVTYPDNFTTETETTIAQVRSLAENPDVEAIVFVQAVAGASAAVDKAREVRPDILVICGTIGEDANVISKKADIVMGVASLDLGTAIIDQAHSMGAKTFVHYSFPRHLGINTIAVRRELMMKRCEELGIEFVDATAPDPTGDAGVPGTQQAVLEDVPRMVDLYGTDTAFYSTNCGMQEPMIRRVMEHKAIYPQPCCPSPFHAYPAALGIDVKGHEGDVPYMLEQIKLKVAEGGNTGRMANWPVPINMLEVEAGVKYAEKWIKGETNGRVDGEVLTQLIVDVVEKTAGEGTRADVSLFEEPQADGSVIKYDNYFMILCDYYVF
ncbi:MAG: DUF3798 domain-containing protein [Clostridiales bacterium]|nr:DUF3798 domain-containing protein [Clostridiales bacterium]